MKNKGFATLELLFASFILSMFLLLLFATLLLSSQILNKNKVETQAMIIAQKFIEQAQTYDFADIGVSGGNPSGAFAGEYVYTYDNITYKLYPEVLWIDDEEDGKGVTDSNPQDYKQIKATVKWSHKGQNYEKSLSTYIYK